MLGGFLVLSSRTGLVLQSQMYAPGFGLPGSKQDGGEEAVGNADEMNVGSLLYAIVMNARSLVDEDQPGSSKQHEDAGAGITLLCVGDMDVHFAMHRTQPAICVTFVNNCFGQERGAELARTILDRFVAKFDSQLTRPVRLKGFTPVMGSILTELPKALAHSLSAALPAGRSLGWLFVVHSPAFASELDGAGPSPSAPAGPTPPPGPPARSLSQSPFKRRLSVQARGGAVPFLPPKRRWWSPKEKRAPYFAMLGPLQFLYVPEAGPLPAPDERGLEALVTLVHAAGRLSSAPSYGPVGPGGDEWGPRPPQRLRCFSVVYRGALAPGVAGSRADAYGGGPPSPGPGPGPAPAPVPQPEAGAPAARPPTAERGRSRFPSIPGASEAPQPPPAPTATAPRPCGAPRLSGPAASRPAPAPAGLPPRPPSQQRPPDGAGLQPRGLFGFLRGRPMPRSLSAGPALAGGGSRPPGSGGTVAPSPRPSAAGVGAGSTRLVAWRAGDLLVAAAMREGPGSNSNRNSNSLGLGLEGLTAAVESDVHRLRLLFALLASRSLRTAQHVS
eukprot:tig00020629_g12452.t1